MKKFFAALLLSSTAYAAPPAYLDGVPLATQINNAVRDCAPSDRWTMPVIAWGADEVTLLANGGMTTTPNSVLGRKGLKITLKHQDDFQQQVRAFLSCDSPFLRVTMGMAFQAADLTESDARTRMVAIYQHSWSAGGDVLVARADVRSPADLKGKTIVVQRYGPHVDYLLKVLSDAGLSRTDVTIKFVSDLTGTGNTPSAALRNDGTIAAVVVISPDAAVLTSDNAIGTGAEGSVKGAHNLFSTRSANRIITDLYFVRRDFYETNKASLSAFVSGLLEAESAARTLAQSRTPDWSTLMKLSAKFLLEDEKLTPDAAAMWADAETTGRGGNLKFFTDPNDLRGFGAVARETDALLRRASYTATQHTLTPADWDWRVVTGLSVAPVEVPKFDQIAAGQAVGKMHAQGTIDSNTLFALDVHFKPNQKDFSYTDYGADFDKVATLAATYGGAVITVEGHADPLGYLQTLKTMEKNGAADRLVLARMVQSGRNLSVQRAQSVRDAVIAAAKGRGISLDPSQFEVVGLGYETPATGICGDRPCEPKTQQEWLSNMRVKFRVVNVEAEASAFVPVH